MPFSLRYFLYNNDKNAEIITSYQVMFECTRHEFQSCLESQQNDPDMNLKINVQCTKQAL